MTILSINNNANSRSQALMCKAKPDLPKLDWPEHYGPDDGRERVDDIVQIFRTHCGIDILGEGVRLVFVPDPPLLVDLAALAREQLSDTGSPELTTFPWGVRGLALTSSSRPHFRRLIAFFLAAKSTTLTILALRDTSTKASKSAPASIGDLQALIPHFLNSEPSRQAPLEYAGLFFDMGLLTDAKPMAEH